MTWLKKHNPEIDWKTRNILFIQYPCECNVGHGNQKEKKKKLFKKHDLKLESMDIMVEDMDKDVLNEEIDFMEIVAIVADSHIKGKELVENQGKTIEEIVPMQFHKYLRVFSEEKCK